MKRVLITGDGYADRHFSALQDAGYEIVHLAGDPPLPDVLDKLPGASVHILGGSERFGANEFGIAKQLELISFVGAGVGAFVDQDLARAHGVRVMNTPPVMAHAVAEHTVGMLLSLRRGIYAQNRAVKESRIPSLVSQELADARIGFVGLGNVGLRVATILHNSFGSRVAYYARSRKLAAEEALKIDYLALDELFRWSEIVVLAVPTTPETQHIVDRERLSLLAPSSILINTAGAQLVEPLALKAALETGELRAAAFDGYYIEPLPRADEDPHGLLALPDDMFVVTPHTAAKTTQTWQRMVDHAVRNAVEHASGAHA